MAIERKKFKIDDTIWYARAGQSDCQITCPDCLGTRRLRVIMGDNSEVSIDCACCERGYLGCTGTITEYKFKAELKSAIIDGIEQNRDETRYRIGCWIINANDAFETPEEAGERAKQLVKEAVDAERQRLISKEKPAKTWAQNASYHRQRIKQAQKDLDYHTAKLSVAAFKSKEDKAVEVPK